MPKFEKGHKLSPGREKGSKNKFTTLRNDFLKAFEIIGGIKALAEWGRKERNKMHFYKMIVSMLPKDINLGNQDGEALQITISDKLLPQRKGNGGGNGKDTPDT